MHQTAQAAYRWLWLEGKSRSKVWWGGVDWGGLGMWNVRVGMIGCRPVEMWWWRGLDVRVEGGRLGMNVWRMIWRCLVYILNGQCSGICGEASYLEERLTLAERGRNGRFKNKWWWWWCRNPVGIPDVMNSGCIRILKFFCWRTEK